MIDYSLSNLLPKLNNIKNIHTTFVVFSILFIIVCLVMTMINTYKLGECRTGRSNGKLKPHCYSNLSCSSTNDDSSYVKLSVGICPVPSAVETITFPTYANPFTDTFVMNIDYNNDLPAGGLDFYGDTKIGICTGDETIYLGNISAFSTIEEKNVFKNKTASIIYYYLYEYKENKKTFLNSYNVNEYATQNFIQYQVDTTQSEGLCVTSNMNGIFGISPHNFSYNPGYSRGPFDAREYYFDVSRQSYLNAINPSASNKIISCVDPSLVFPCRGKVYNPAANKWCDSTITQNNCVSFCAPHTDIIQASPAGTTSVDGHPYQYNIFDPSLSNKILVNPKAAASLPYT